MGVEVCPTRSRRAGEPGHLWTSSKSIDGGPKRVMCSWCGRLGDDEVDREAGEEPPEQT